MKSVRLKLMVPDRVAVILGFMHGGRKELADKYNGTSESARHNVIFCPRIV